MTVEKQLTEALAAVGNQLAAANQLLADALAHATNGWERRVRAHLAAQPATAPAKAHGTLYHGEWVPAQDEAERTCRGCREGTQDHHTCQRAIVPPQTYVPPSVLRAELARREAKR